MVIQMNKDDNSNNILTNDFPVKKNYLKDVEIKPIKVKKKRRKPKKWVLLVIIVILISTFSANLLVLIDWNKDNIKTNKIVEEINNIDTNITEIEDNENTENINEPTDKSSEYWYYITFPLINVNFNELIKKNKDTVAWINVNNTNINYPIVQTTDNDFYLDHSYNKEANEAGWVFLDFRNKNNLTDKNNIIYAHSRLDKTMFGSLSKVLKESWYTDRSNHIIRISTPEEDSLWQIFSVYIIKEETYYITTNFDSNDEYTKFLKTIKSRSKYNFNTTLNESDRIITLSTCYSDTERTVVHAKLIKKSTN